MLFRDSWWICPHGIAPVVGTATDIVVGPVGTEGRSSAGDEQEEVKKTTGWTNLFRQNRNGVLKSRVGSAKVAQNRRWLSAVVKDRRE
jgi:hypothetical protein